MKKTESVFIAIVLLIISTATFLNLLVSERRSRDNQRKNDIRSISDAVLAFNNDFAFFPEGKDGKIAACRGKINIELKIYEFETCEWGVDAITDPSDPNYPPYITRLPQEPHSSDGVSYYYISNGGRFQLFASLEGKDEAEYDAKIEARGLPCGSEICNFGIASGKTPLDRSLEEYEKELIEAQK